MRNLTVSHRNQDRLRPASQTDRPRTVHYTLDRIAILNNSGHAPGDRTHLTALLADHWRANGIEVVELSGTGTFVEADLLFLNLSRAVIPDDYARFAAQYPVSFNADSSDIRKHRYADGQLLAGSAYKGPVIARNDTGYSPPVSPTASPFSFLRMLNGRRSVDLRDVPPANCVNYHIYPSIREVPAEKFGPEFIVQKFLPENGEGRFVLRQYYFLADQHFLSLQTSGTAIIHTSTPLSLEEWVPPEKLLDLRRHLSLDYGRIDFVLIDGEPFVINASRSPALPDSKEAGFVTPAFSRMADVFAETLVDTYTTMEKSVF